MIATKICGITNVEDGQLAVELGAMAIGFIFYPPSQRYIEPAAAKIIADALGNEVCKVGVFVNTDVETINGISTIVGLDMVQLSGDETAADWAGISLPVIKTLHLDDATVLAVAVAAVGAGAGSVKAFLLDSKLAGQFGGTGRTWNWDKVDLGQLAQPIILSGGLNPGNVGTAIEQTRPAAIDISSGVEAVPGRKSSAKLRALFKVLANYEGTNEQPFK